MRLESMDLFAHLKYLISFKNHLLSIIFINLLQLLINNFLNCFILLLLNQIFFLFYSMKANF